MRTPIRVLELRSVRGTGGGPEKTILHGAAWADATRLAVTVCYIRDARDPIFPVGARARALGLDYVEIVERHSFDPAVWPALRQIVRDRAIDIVHAHEYKTDLLALLLARASGVRPLATVHGWSGDTWRERAYYVADKRLLARFPRVIAVSSRIRAELLRRGAHPDRIRVVLNGIDPARFRRDPDQRSAARARFGLMPTDIALGGIGRLESEKRVDTLLHAVAMLRPQHRHLKVLVAGDGTLRSALAETARHLGVGDICRFLGHVSDIGVLHQALDVFVQASEREGAPNAVLEAMAMETPVVATDVGGTGQLVEHDRHGLLVPPFDAAALAAAIDRTLQDRAATGQRVAAARARVERELSFDRRMATVEAIYGELMNGSEPCGEGIRQCS